MLFIFLSDLDECTVNQPCQNSGVCTNSVGSYSCDCTGTGYEGTDCDTGEMLFPCVSKTYLIDLCNQLFLESQATLLFCKSDLFTFRFIQKIYIIVSKYFQEIPQSQTADNPVAPQGRATQPSRDTRKTN